MSESSVTHTSSSLETTFFRSKRKRGRPPATKSVDPKTNVGMHVPSASLRWTNAYRNDESATVRISNCLVAAKVQR